MVQLVKNPPANAGDARDVGSIPGLEEVLGEGNGNPLQYSCLDNSMDRGAWQATVHGIIESDMTKPLTLSFFMLFSILVYHRILSRVPCAIK